MAVKKNKVDEKNIQPTKTCIICSSELKPVSFYNCRSEIIGDRFSICKNCACRIANNSIEDMHKILRLLDVPFIPDIVKETEGNDNPFSRYMLLINNPKKKFDDGRTYSDLRYCDSPTLKEITDINEYIYKSDENMGTLYSLFGDKWKKEQLIGMNKELEDMIIQYGGSRDEMPTMDLYCELIRLKWLAREQMDNNNIQQGKALLAERNKMLKDNNMTVQAMREKTSNESFGIEIDYAEYRPIIPKKKYFDYSGLMHMFKYFITHQERFYGQNNKPVDDDFSEMSDYKNKHPREYKAEMFEDDFDFDVSDDVINEE